MLQDAAGGTGNGTALALDSAVETVDLTIANSAGTATVIVEVDEGAGYVTALVTELVAGAIALTSGSLAFTGNTRRVLFRRNENLKAVSLRARISAIVGGTVTATAITRRR